MDNKEKFSENEKIQDNEKEKVPETLKHDFIVLHLDLQLEQFEEIKLTDDISIRNLLSNEKIILVVDHKNNRVWLWKGAKTTAKMKFISAQKVSFIRDKYGIEYTITSIDEGDEPSEFKQLLGL
jgi:hypothetical protein